MEVINTTKQNDAKRPNPPPTRNQLSAELAAMEGVPVKLLWFCVGMNNKPDLPLPDSAGGMGKLGLRPGRSITWLAKAHLFRVVQTSLDSKVGTTTFYIPEAWATFEPLE